MTFLHGLVILVAGFAGGTMNSIAGGGTLVTFPTLLWHGLAPIHANATNTLALWPGSLSGAWGYRDEVRRSRRRDLWLIAPSLVGGLTGAVLLRSTPPLVFSRLVPFLILFATLLFMVQGPVQSWMNRRRAGETTAAGAVSLAPEGPGLRNAVFLQFLAGTYGGYFGAGMGIVMLAILGWIGLTDIHQMNGLKNLCSFAVNFVAAAYFVVAGLVHWPEALVMMVGATAGGYCSAGVARRLGREFARRAVIVIGLAITLVLLLRR